jgi:TetR/AcrR family transcriptional repressor of lmrAB and yxaGH operons
LRRNGYAGTPLSAIASEGRAPMGSVYFHFPGGKEQLAAEAMRYGSRGVLDGLKRALESTADPAKGLARCAKAWADDLERSNWEDGCPVAATALQVSTTSEPLRLASADIMASWGALIADCLQRCGCSKKEATVAAELALALLEGAELLARIQRDRSPLDRAAVAMRSLLPARLRRGPS